MQTIQQMWKARGVWARVGQVLGWENVMPWMAAKFYKAVIQAILLYGSKTRNLMESTLARLEGFHICVAYRMAWRHGPKRGTNCVLVYPKLAVVLEECRMRIIVEYIRKCRNTIAIYVAMQPILDVCREVKRQRESMPRQWWWEQPMSFNVVDALGSDAESNSVASLAD